MARKSPPATLNYDDAVVAGHKRYLGKECVKCGSTDKLVSIKFCYDCHARMRSEWSTKNRDRHLQMQRDWSSKNYEAKKKRSKANGTWLHDPIKKHKYDQLCKAKDPEAHRQRKRRGKDRRAHIMMFDDASRRYYMNSPTRKTFKHLTREEKEMKVKEREFGCAYCGEVTRLALDHINPISRGGAHEFDNFQWLCNHHNSQKNTKTHEEYVVWCIDRDIALPLIYCTWTPEIEIFRAVSPAHIEIFRAVSPWETFICLASQLNVD